MKISENKIIIRLESPVHELYLEDILEIYCLLSALKHLEEKKGNTIDKAWLKIKYEETLKITEYINIFGLIKNSSLYDYLKYFKSFKERFGTQNNDTKLNLNDYITNEGDIEQSIEVIMLFNLTIPLEGIQIHAKLISQSVKILNLHSEIWKTL